MALPDIDLLVLQEKIEAMTASALMPVQSPICVDARQLERGIKEVDLFRVDRIMKNVNTLRDLQEVREVS